MMNKKAFSFNKDAKYRVGGVYPKLVNEPNSQRGYELLRKGVLRGVLSDNAQHIVVTAGPQAKSFHASFAAAKSFYANFAEILGLPGNSTYRIGDWITPPYDNFVQAWRHNPMQFWQTQLNFSLWCATAGCGVSYHDHVLARDAMMSSLFEFHVYYTTRKILAEMECPLPEDGAWEKRNNHYNPRAYAGLCREFGVPPSTDWRPRTAGPDGGVFCGKAACSQDQLGVQLAWSTFILDKSNGFTAAGISRINDSIRTYVWAILGAQAQTRASILGDGTAFDAQKQFIANVEDAISRPVDIPSAIQRYQDVLRYARSKVDYVFGKDLYMAPSDMELQLGPTQDYNNDIVIATDNQVLGINPAANTLGSTPDTPLVSLVAEVDDGHANERTALVIAAVISGLVGLWLFGKK